VIEKILLTILRAILFFYEKILLITEEAEYMYKKKKTEHSYDPAGPVRVGSAANNSQRFWRSPPYVRTC
jgi:hypothetical protein